MNLSNPVAGDHEAGPAGTDDVVDDGAVAEPDDAGADDVAEAGEETVEEDQWVTLGGDVSLDLDEANVIAAHLGATVVLVAGNREAGKTTLLVEFYARFLDGPYNRLEFAGSETLDAFDARHFDSRVDSGNEEEDMEHTEDVDMRFLHLRLADEEGEQGALLLTDLKGELFSDLAEGATVLSRTPIARRADKTLLIIDGQEILDPATRQIAIRDARLVLGALTEPAGIRPETPVNIVLSKADLLTPEDVEWFAKSAEGLIEFTKSRGVRDVTSMVLAARPDHGSSREGLDEVTSWMWQRRERPPLVAPDVSVPSDRVFVTATMGVQ